MASGRLVDYLAHGIASARPSSLTLTTGAIGIYYATDTSTLSVWDGSAWHTVTGGGGGGVTSLNSLTGSLTIANGTGITVSVSGSTITIAATGGSAQTIGLSPGGFIDPTTADGQLIYRKATTVTALQIGFIGDSITAGTTLGGGGNAPPPHTATDLTQGTLTVTATNQGQSGATSADWIPGAGSGYLAAAKTAFASAGVRLVHIMLGTNDSKTAVATTQAQYRANLQAICADLIAAGYLVAIGYPPYLNTSTGVFDPASTGRVAGYCAAIDNVVDGDHIFQSDRTAQDYFQANPSALQGDGVHPTQPGSDHLAQAWASAIQGIVNALTNQSPLQPLTIGSGLQITGGVLSATGGTLGIQHEETFLLTGLATGKQYPIPVPRAIQINGWYLASTASGSLVLDIYADLYANYPPSSAQSICSSNKPALSAAQKNKDLTLSGWLNTLSDDEVMLINVDSVSGITEASFTLAYTKIVGGPPTVTWNPADKEANFTLSTGNLSVTRGGGSSTWGGIRATLARNAATANHYFELVAGSNQQMVGVADSTQPITSSHFIGDAAGGWSHYASSGNKINSGTQTAYGVTWTTGDRIGVLLKNGKLYFRKNGTWMNSADPIAETGYAFSGITGNVFPAHSMFTPGDTSTAYFSASTIVGSLPSGTSSWGA